MKTRHEIDSFCSAQKRKRENIDYLRLFRSRQAQRVSSCCL